MFSVIINGKKYEVEDNAPLKETLTDAGFMFPCGGYGRCGKCRITCPQLPVSELDRRFLTPSDIDRGVRLACDKKVCDSLNISCELTEAKPTLILHECSIAATVTDSEISVSIVSDELVETVTRPNPLLAYGSVTNLLKSYETDRTPTKLLRAVIDKESVELFEKYGAAKAQTTAIAAKGLYLKILTGAKADSDADDIDADSDVFDLPAESVYLLPCKGDFFGGELLAEAIKLKERSLLIDCEKTVSFLNIGDEDALAAAIWDCDYSELAIRCIKAAVRLLTKDCPKPTVYLYGPGSYAVEDALQDIGFNCIQAEKSPQSVTDALLNHRTRSKLLKEKNRTTFIKLYDSELFQRFLTEETN